MTREELVEELNKIKGAKAKLETISEFTDGNINIVLREDNSKDIVLTYTYPKTLVFGWCSSMIFENRTPEQVLTIVKMLVE